MLAPDGEAGSLNAPVRSQRSHHLGEVTGDRVRASAAPLACRDLDVGASVLARQHEDPAKSGALGRSDVGPHVVTDHRDVAASQVSADLLAQVADDWVKNAGVGLPTMVARVSAANSSPTTNEPESRVGPSGVSHHGLRCMPMSVRRPGSSRNARLRLSKVASSGESPMTTAAAAAPGAPRLLVRQQPLARELGFAHRPRRGRRAAAPGKCRAVQAADADSADSNRSAGIGAPSFGRPARQRRATHGRGVRDDPVRARPAARDRRWHRPPPERPSRQRR